MKNIVRETAHQEDIEEFLNISWRHLYTRRMTYQKTRLYHYGFWKGFSDICGYQQHYELNRYIGGDMVGYVVESEIDGLEKHLAGKFSDAQFVERSVQFWPDKIEREFGEYLTFMGDLPSELSSLKPQEIIGLLDRYYELENKISIDYWILFDNVERALSETLYKLLSKQGLSASEALDLLRRLSEPRKIIPLDEEHLSLLEMALAGEGQQAELLRRHAQEYSYMPMYDIDYEPYALEYFEKRLAEFKRWPRERVEKEIVEIQQKYQGREEFFVETVEKGKWDNHLLVLLGFFSAYGYLKDRKPYARDKGSYHFRRVFEEISRRLGLTLSQTLFMHESELEGALLEDSAVPADILDKRMKNSVYLCRDNEIFIVTDVTLLREVDKALAVEEAATELRGVGVSGGTVQGKVSIVLSNNDFGKFKAGEILVTSATRPDFVPLMRKAAAVLTDEGGILSHAAIVSRELGKPCVVGLKQATHVLKDGDLVEVDAERGIIKKL